MTTSNNAVNSRVNTVTVTSAQMLALQGSPVTLIDAPGAGNYIQVSLVIIFLDYNTVSYVSGGATSIRLDYLTDIGGSANLVDVFTQNYSIIYETTVPTSNGSPTPAVSLINQSVILLNSGDNLVDGDSDVIIKLYYNIISTGL